MDPTVITAVVGVVGVALGAGISAIASVYSARQKERELKFNYEVALREKFVENAKVVLQEVYVPIHVAISEILREYEALRPYMDSERTSDYRKRKFCRNCLKQVQAIEDILKQGGDAYLTIELDEVLRDFLVFLRTSLESDSYIAKNVTEFEVTLPIPFVSRLGMRISRYSGRQYALSSGRSQRQISYGKSNSAGDVGTKSGENARILGRILSRMEDVVRVTALNTSLNLPFLNMVRVNRYLSAPISSNQFEDRLQTDCVKVKALLKEVILGGIREVA